jgi:hypothetical protein
MTEKKCTLVIYILDILLNIFGENVTSKHGISRKARYGYKEKS